MPRHALPLALSTCLFSSVTTAALAQMSGAAAPQCTAPAELPASLASWRAPTALTAVSTATKTGDATVAPGEAVRLKLLPTPSVSYPVRPEKPGSAASFGGLVRFTIGEAGRWRVVLGSSAWVDVVKDGKAAVSVNHSHGPACSGIRKMVDYDLTPGTYTLTIAGNSEPEITALVTRLP